MSLVATVQHPAAPLHVVGTCLEWETRYDDDRLAQAAAVADLATAPELDGPAPVLVLGDLNAAPDSPLLRPLHDVLIDAWSTGGGEPGAVSLPSDHPFASVELEELIDRRIDHVMVRPGRPGQRLGASGARTLGDAVDGLHPSDHRAVLCDVTWTDAVGTGRAQPADTRYTS